MTEYGTDTKDGRKFGDATLLGDEGGAFFDKPLNQQIAELGWSHGCPVVNSVIEKNGADYAVHRYAELNFTWKLILDTVNEIRPPLHDELAKDTERAEKVGKHEPVSVPASYLDKMSQTNTPSGYALPRILVEQFGRGKERTQKRILKGLQILENTVKVSTSPLEFTARLSEAVIKADAKVDSVLSHTLSSGSLGEQNFFELNNKLAKELQTHAPKLWKRYLELTPQEKQEKGIAEL